MLAHRPCAALGRPALASILLLVGAVALPHQVAAQLPGDGPTVTITPESGGFTVREVDVFIKWESSTAWLDYDTRSITFNGSDVTDSFSHSSSSSSGTVQLADGSNSIMAQICDTEGFCGFDSENYIYDLTAPSVAITPDGGYSRTSSTSLTIDWSDNYKLDGGSRSIELNGTDVTLNFDYSGTATSAQSIGSVTWSESVDFQILGAQICDTSGNCGSHHSEFKYDPNPPSVTITPSGGTYGSASRSITIDWADDWELNLSDRVMTLNGNTVTSKFSYSGTSGAAQDTGTITLASGENTFSAEICDKAGNCTSKTVTYTYDGESPTVSISPGSTATMESPLDATITWTDDLGLDASTHRIELNGTDVKQNFVWSGGGTSASSSGSVELTYGDNNLYAYICDDFGRCTSNQVTYTFSDPRAPIVSSELHNGDLFSPDLCAAGCSDFTLAYSTPAYFSLDQPRSVTLRYSAAESAPFPVVSVLVTDSSGTAPDQMSIMLKRKWSGAWETLHTGGTEVFYTHTSSRYQQSILSAGFDASSLATGAYDYTVYVRSWWGGSEFRESSMDVRVLVVNAGGSPYGSGWWIAGLQQISFNVFGGSEGILLTDGAGGATFFEKVSCNEFADPKGGTTTDCDYDGPPGDFTGINYHYNTESGGGYTRSAPDGSKALFDVDGRLTEARDRFSNKVLYTYNAAGRISTITDAIGKQFTFGYGADNNLDWVRDPASRYSYVTINSSGEITSIQDPEGGHPFQGMTYPAGRLESYQDRAGSSWSVSYDFAGRVSAVTAPAVTIASGAQASPVTSVTSRSKNLLYDTIGGTSSSPLPRRTTAHNTVSVTDPEGGITAFRDMDRFGQPLVIEDAVGREWRFEHNNPDGLLTLQVTPSADTTDLAWTGGNLTQVSNRTTGKTVTYEYGSYSQLARISGATTEVTNFLGSLGRVDSTQVGGTTGPIVARYIYDSRGRVTSVTDGDGYTTSVEYQTGGFMNTDSVSRLGRTTKFAYDSRGRVSVVTDPLQQTARIEYDDLNRTLASVNAAGDSTIYSYGSLGLQSVRDALGNVYQRHPNVLGWDTATTDPGGRQDFYAYDENGRLITHTDRRGRTVNYEYDAAGDLTSRTADGLKATYSLSPDLRTFRAELPGVSVDSIRYDRLGRVTEQFTWRNGIQYRVSTQYIYENTLRRSRTRLFTGPNVDHTAYYDYNGSGQLRQLNGDAVDHTDIGYNGRLQATTFRYRVSNFTSYDTAYVSYPSTNRPGRIRYSNNLGLGWADTFGTRYGHDELSRVDTRANDLQTEWSEFTYDLIGQLTRVAEYEQDIGDGRHCTADEDTGELECSEVDATLVGSTTYTWDELGNPWGETVDAGNRLTSLLGDSMSYDSAGNLLSSTRAGVTYQYTWNDLGQLTSVHDGTTATSFTYDALGRRIGITHGGTTTQFVLDGANVIADLDAAGNALRYYNYYDGVGQLHSMRAGSSGYIYHRDLTGNVMGLTRVSDGAIAGTYDYDGFGVTAANEALVANRFRYGSGEQDPTGLYYFRNRYYDPQMRRWISEDPIGLAGGINLYAYVGNNPINYVDPWGLEECSLEEANRGECAIDMTPITATADRGGGVGTSPFSSNFGNRGFDTGAVGGNGGGGGSLGRQVVDRISACKTELAMLGVALAADGAFFLTGGATATVRAGGLIAAAVRSGVPHVIRGGVRAGGQALAAVPLMVDGNALGAGVMQAGVYWTAYESNRTAAAAHTIMSGRDVSVWSFVPVAASLIAGTKAFGCLF